MQSEFICLARCHQHSEFGPHSCERVGQGESNVYIYTSEWNNRPRVPLQSIIVSSFPESKRPGRAVEHFPPSRAKVMNALTISPRPYYLPSLSLISLM